MTTSTRCHCILRHTDQDIEGFQAALTIKRWETRIHREECHRAHEQVQCYEDGTPEHLAWRRIWASRSRDLKGIEYDLQHIESWLREHSAL